MEHTAHVDHSEQTALPPIPDPLAAILPIDVFQDEQVQTDDIYRGPHPPPRPAKASSTTSSSSSSSSSSGGFPLSNLASTVERAISRWARRGRVQGSSSSSSDSSSTSSSSSSSSNSDEKSHKKKKKYAASVDSGTTTLTTRRQEREAARMVPRGFILLLPPVAHTPQPAENAVIERVVRTESLKEVISHLGKALKSNAVVQRQTNKGISQAARAHVVENTNGQPVPKKKRDQHVAFQLDPHSRPSRHPERLTARRGKPKPREVPRQFFWQKAMLESSGSASLQQAWWLDISSPTWEDMRTLGKLLQLHPLTLEDILQKEPREKFELFPRLGYYFVVFRAIEINSSSGSIAHSDDRSSIDDVLDAMDTVDGVNVYFVVFREGICTFHFEDISAHTDTIRRKVLQLEETRRMSSDWIAHGIIDSIVDAFFPLLRDIAREVEGIEDVISGLENDWHATSSPSSSETRLNDKDTLGSSSTWNEKGEFDLSSSIHRPRNNGFSSLLKPLRSRLSQFASSIWYLIRHPTKAPPKGPSSRLRRLLKMASTRRLVTALTRLLYSKAEVIAQIRKRLAGHGEVAIYLGDVQDHIITLQQSLVHYERMLGHSHPAYLSHLRFQLSEAKGGMDHALVTLTIIAVVFLAMQGTLQMGGMNVRVPRSMDYVAFGVILSIAVLVGLTVVAIARLWWIQSKRKSFSKRK